MTYLKIPHCFRCGIFSVLIAVALLLPFPADGQAAPGLLPGRGSAVAFTHRAAYTTGLTVLALRVAFTPDNNLSTTGDGTFLTEPGEVLCDGFRVDPPPHNAPYFQAHLLAMANYFEQVSGGHVTFDLAGSAVYPGPDDSTIVLGPMAGYRPATDDADSSDILLAILARDALAEAFAAGEDPREYRMVVIFHAGLGQDFTYDYLDPTPLDIPSAYIDPAMIRKAFGSPALPLPGGASYDRPILLLPEGQNHIYYDEAGDIFPGSDDLCDVQIGLTGTFALLMGYALGLPPLFDTVTGEPGVGVFGLMDMGSNNGLGTIPAPPTAWTRIHMGWEAATELWGNCSLTARRLPAGGIGRIALSSHEYLLIENRNSWLLPGVDMDSLRYRNRWIDSETGNLFLPHYFDYLTDSAHVTLDTATGVITGVPNYDMGLPGSGLLIWHVDETRYTAAMQGLNDDRAARAVALVEADGAVDLGFPTAALFLDPTAGWRWDLWYADNEAFFMANSDLLTGNQARLLTLDSETFPSSRLNSGAGSGIAVRDIGPAGMVMTFAVETDGPVTKLPQGSRLLGYNGIDWVYALRDSLWLGGQSIAVLGDSVLPVISEHDAPDQPGAGFWVLNLKDPGYTARRYLPDGSLEFTAEDTVRLASAEDFLWNPLFFERVRPYFNEGKLTFWVVNDSVPVPPDTSRLRYLPLPFPRCLPSPLTDGDSISFIWNSRGDVDGDGVDEYIFTTTAAPGNLEVRDENGTLLDGFPVYGDFRQPALIANLLDDIRPELVVLEGGDIALYSPEGAPSGRIGLRARPGDLFLFSHTDGQVGLANGDRIHWFTPDEPNLQWVTYHARHSRTQVSLNDGEIKVPQPKVMDAGRVYNYPNPVTSGRTTIRFYTGLADRATIRIFTVDGLPVEKVEITELATNGYTEWVWEVGDHPSGLYYAVVEVMGVERVSALVKIVVVR